MTNIKINANDDFFETIGQMMENSVLIENSSRIDSYINEELTDYSTTDRGLNHCENWFIEKHYQRLKDTADSILLSSPEDRVKYNGDPARLSYDKFGTTDYWYIILLINDMSHPDEFRNMTNCYIPNINEVESIIEEELANKKRIEEMEEKE